MDAGARNDVAGTSGRRLLERSTLNAKPMTLDPQRGRALHGSNHQNVAGTDPAHSIEGCAVFHKISGRLMVGKSLKQTADL